MQCSPTLTRVTGVTNCWRGLGKGKRGKKNKNRTKVSSLHFRTEFGAAGRTGEKKLQSRTRRAGGGNTHRWHMRENPPKEKR